MHSNVKILFFCEINPFLETLVGSLLLVLDYNLAHLFDTSRSEKKFVSPNKESILLLHRFKFIREIKSFSHYLFLSRHCFLPFEEGQTPLIEKVRIDFLINVKEG